ncbi:MAG: hypothetical protein HY866_05130 [Chloroflexi bacterium]|nr:hypothetical protein [Chloroflexota bacterium]
MMSKRLTRILIRFFITIVIVLAFGGIISLYTGTLSEEQQDEVLIKAVPFVAVFISIVLAFICVIVIVAVTLEGKVPLRSYRPIEFMLIAGILLGVTGLFQGWKLFVYEFGFLVLLFSLLAFMVWSHLQPMPLRQSRNTPPLSRQAHIIGVGVALAVWAATAFFVIGDNRPAAPYDVGQTLWEYKNDEEKAQIKDEADSEYRNAKIPVFVLISLLPAGLVYFGVREIVAAQQRPGQRILPVEGVAVPSD